MGFALTIPIQLNVLGLCSDDVQQHLLGSAPSELHQIMLHAPTAESALFEFIAEHEIGLALEPGFSENNKLARSNKLYSYGLTGCYSFISKTPAQEQFLREFPDAGVLIDLCGGSVPFTVGVVTVYPVIPAGIPLPGLLLLVSEGTVDLTQALVQTVTRIIHIGNPTAFSRTGNHGFSGVV